MSYESNMNDLMNAAKIKLEAQKQSSADEDIYADMRAEMNTSTETQSVPTINRYMQPVDGPSIAYEPESEEEYYIDVNDTPVFEGGPGVSQIELWKKQYGKEKILHTQIIERHFVFRTLNRYEYKQIVAVENIDALYREEIICSTCVLWPRNYDFKAMAGEDGGYPSTLAQIIMENSGFTKEYGIEVL